MVDLRSVLGSEQPRTADPSCVVIVSVDTLDHSRVQIGVVVDSMDELFNIQAEDIDTPSNSDRQADLNYVQGIAKIKRAIQTAMEIDAPPCPNHLSELGLCDL